MKSTILLSLISASFIVACSKSGGGNSEKPNATSNSPKSHLSSECPALNGSFTLVVDGQTRTKRIKMTESAGGFDLDDSGSAWVIDGKEHTRDAGEGKILTYKGSCSKQVLTLELFEGSTALGQMEYRWVSVKELVIESKNNDPRLGPSSKEIWAPETETQK